MIKIDTYPNIQKAASEALKIKPSSVKTCWIAEVKREKELTRGHAHNYGKGKGAAPCPTHIKRILREIIKN